MSTLSVSSIQNAASPISNIAVNADGSVTLGLYRTPGVAPTPVQTGTLWYDIGGAGLVIWDGASWAGVGGGGGGTVTGVVGTAPIVSSGGATPAISITPATSGAAGSMSAADKAKLDGAATIVSAVTGTLPITVATGTSTPVIAINAATTLLPGSVQLADATASKAGTSAALVSTPAFSVPKDASGMTGAAILPSGTNAQRAAIATPVAGMARLNTSITALEYYNGTNWIPLSPNAPTCLVRATATQNVVSGVTTKVLNLNDVAFDNYSFFNTTTNQFKPTIPGCYQVNCLIRMRALPVGTTDVSLSQVYLYKNGLLYSRLTEIVGPLFSVLQTQGNTIVQMNGTTDYLEMWGQATASSPCFDYVGSAFTSFFSAVLVGV